MVNSPPIQNSPMTLSAMSQRREMPYSPYEQDLAKEHPPSYQKDVWGCKGDPRDYGHPKVGFLDPGTTDVLGRIIVGGCPVH